MIPVDVKPDIELPTVGTHQATIVEVADNGIGESNFTESGTRLMLKIVFRIDDQRGVDGEPIPVEWNVTRVVRPHSDLGRLLKALDAYPKVMGVAAFDAESIVGRALIIVIHQIKKGPTMFANVSLPRTFSTPTRRQIATLVEEVEGECQPN